MCLRCSVVVGDKKAQLVTEQLRKEVGVCAPTRHDFLRDQYVLNSRVSAATRARAEPREVSDGSTAAGD